MSEKMLREMITSASQTCEETFAEEHEIRPMFHAFTADGNYLVLSPPFEDKDHEIMMVREMFKMQDVVRYVFMVEAWTLSRPLSAKEIETTDSIHDHPERVEIVMIQAEDYEAGEIHARRPIIRPANAKPYLGPLEIIGRLERAHGRMVGLLPVRGKQH